MNARGLAVLALVVTTLAGGCSHLPVEDRYPSKAQVIEITGCKPMAALKSIEMGLFLAGFARQKDRDPPIPFELLERFVTGQHGLVTFTKSDFEPNTEGGSVSYKEFPNRYKITACEEHAGNLFLVIVRHDPETGDQFLGARLSDALKRSGCSWAPVAPPRNLGFYKDTTEDDLLRFVRRGRCRDYATAQE